ncbi:MAG: hypothetical protein DRJ64_04880 [Thermoprotei archaeon]|mgnify:CR=1 FL=1|nr:MAG: hypothetical protein DRJ64_04880 [Thermoprotei archaeon]HDD64036.1 hypothetical protein [Thermoprotei archaeon]
MSKGSLKVWRSRIVPTTRGAIFRAKRWFYATFYSKSKGEAKELSKENWTKLARILVEKSNQEGVSENAARVLIYYYDDEGIFKPIKAEIEVFKLEPLKTIEIREEELSS